MGFFSSITNSIGNVLSRAGSRPLAGLPIGFGKNILPLNIQASNTPASVQRPEGLLDDGRVLLPDIPSLSMGGGGTAFGGTGVTTPPAVGGFGAPEQLPGGGYRVYDNRTGKWTYGGGATDPNATPAAQPTSPAVPAAPTPPAPAAPANQDIGQLVFPRKGPMSGGILENLMRVMGGSFPMAQQTENAPSDFGRFLRSMAGNRFTT